MDKEYLRSQDILSRCFINKTLNLRVDGQYHAQDYFNAVYDDTQDALRVAFSDSVGFVYWEHPVDTIADLPMTNNLDHTVRVVRNDGHGNASLYFWNGSGWHQLNIGGGGSVYSNAKPTPETLGGIPSGTTFVNQTMEQMWNALLYPYQNPVFSSFIIDGQAITLEVGDSILASVTFKWTTINDSNINPNSLTILDITNGIGLGTSLSNDGTENIVMPNPVTKTTQDSNVFQINGTDTKSNPFFRNVSYNWCWRLFYGESVNSGPLTETLIKNLRMSILTSRYDKTYSYLGGGYKYICYPSQFGTATSFIDADTGFNIPFNSFYNVSVTNTFSQTTNYNVHRSTNVMGSAINIEVS